MQSRKFGLIWSQHVSLCFVFCFFSFFVLKLNSGISGRIRCLCHEKVKGKAKKENFVSLAYFVVCDKNEN